MKRTIQNSCSVRELGNICHNPCSTSNLSSHCTLQSYLIVQSLWRVNEVRKQWFLSVFLETLKRERFISLVLKKKKYRNLPCKLQVLLFRLHTYKNIAFYLICTLEKQQLLFIVILSFCLVFSLQNKQHQKYC